MLDFVDTHLIVNLIFLAVMICVRFFTTMQRSGFVVLFLTLGSAVAVTTRNFPQYLYYHYLSYGFISALGSLVLIERVKYLKDRKDTKKALGD